MNQQIWKVDVQLEKARKALNFLFLLSFLSSLGVLFSLGAGVNTRGMLLLAIPVIIFIAGRLVIKLPIVGVIVLAGLSVFYLVGWFNILFGGAVRFEFGLSSILFIMALGFRLFVTVIAVGGFYYAVKGMMAKEEYDKKYNTLDEDEF